MAKLADARDLKSRAPKGAWRFDSAPGHQRSWLRSFAQAQPFTYRIWGCSAGWVCGLVRLSTSIGGRLTTG